MRATALYPLVGLLLASAALGAARPGPFRFCYGLDSPGDLPAVRTLGLDTLYLRLAPGDILDLGPTREAIQRAQGQGLKVIIELPTCLTAAYRVSPFETAYTGAVDELIRHVVGELRTEPGLSAWATESMLERRLSLSDVDFRTWLQERYSSLDALNAAWGTRYPNWPSIMRQEVQGIESAAPYKVGRARVDLADYQAEVFQRVMALWVQTLRAEDATRPVLTGRVTLYRSLVSIPAGYDVVCVNMPPDILENDLQAHNPQALDLARRGGKFHVLPVFRVPDNTSPAYRDGLLREWMHHAALHGAVGFGLEDWDILAPFYDQDQGASPRKRLLTNAIRGASAVPCLIEPRASAAIIYSPYASGFEVTGQPVYGYLAGYLPGEPSSLAYDLRLGTRYGGVDYLTVADLAERDLSSYGCLLAPACLSLPPPQARQLEEYIREGGCLLADLGLGVVQTASWTQLPEALQGAFGVLSLGNARERVGQLTAANGLAALSPWPRGAKAQGTFSARTSNTGPATDRRTYPISGWVAEAILGQDAAPLATLSVRFDEEKRPLFAGIVGRQHGAGVALFATHPLWQYWPLADGLSQVLHGHLMARRADYQLAQGGLLQSGPYFGAGDGGAAVFNPERLPAVAQLWAYGARNHAFSNCASQFAAAPGLQGLRPGTALLLAEVPADETLQLVRTPLVVQPRSGEATVLMREYGAERVVFELAGEGAIARPTPRGLELIGTNAVPVRLVLGSGTYRVAAQSRHVVAVKTRTRQARVVVPASPQGELDLSDTYAGSTVTITPE